MTTSPSRTADADFMSPAHLALYRRYRAHVGAPVPWVEALVASMLDDWSFDELDLPTLGALLWEGIGWHLVAPPDDPVAVADEVRAFLAWLPDGGGIPRTAALEACLAYAASPRLVDDLARWLTPIQLEDLDADAWDDRLACAACRADAAAPR